MRFSAEFALALAVLALVLAGALSSAYWHTLAPRQNVVVEAWLAEFDRVAYPEREVCYALQLVPRNFPLKETLLIETRIANNVATASEVGLFETPVSRNTCFSSDHLLFGENIVDVIVGKERLFFHVEKKAGMQPIAQVPAISIISIENSKVKFEIDGINPERYAPVSISVNGRLDHRVYPSAGQRYFSERISLADGENTITIEHGKASASQNFTKPADMQMPLPLGAVFFALGIFVFAAFVFSQSGPLEKLALSLLAAFTLFMAETFVLSLLGALSLFSFLAVYLAAIAVLAIAFRKRFRLHAFHFPHEVHAMEIFAIALLLFVALAYHTISINHVTFWNGFYERQAGALAENFSLPLTDELSYLGRGNSFIPGYFMISASLSWLLGTSGIATFAVVLVLANLFLLLAVLYLGEALGFDRAQRALLFALLMLGLFILLNFAYSPRHTIALAFMLTALAFFIRRHEPLATGLMVGFAAFIQMPLLAAFPLVYVIISRKVSWKPLLWAFAVACVVFFSLYLPHLLNFGFPFEVQMSNWGYLISYPIANALVEIAALLIFFMLILLPDLLRKKFRFDSYTKKLALFAVLGFLAELFITFRWSTFLLLNLAVLFVLFFPREQLRNAHVSRLLAVLMLIGTLFMLSMMQAAPVPEHFQRPMEFIAANTPTDVNILADPLFGHPLEYLSKRKVLADLMVEYAPEEKLNDTYEFLTTKNPAILQKYGISVVFSQSDYINFKAISNQPLQEKLEFRDLDKVYANSVLYIHSVPEQG